MVKAAVSSPSLPFDEAIDAIDELARRCRRLADAVEATTRRRDVRDRRAKILLTILGTRCPTSGRPRKSWYVPGAAARLGAEGIQRAWAERWGEEPPSMRTIRAHLGHLEMACAIARSPGDWLPQMRDPEHPERRPRYPDTFHVLESHESAIWWATTGRSRIEANPDSRFNPTRWKALFARWRTEAARATTQPELFDGRHPDAALAATIAEQPLEGARARAPRGLPARPKPATAAATAAADEIAATCRTKDQSPLDVLAALQRAGVDLQGKMSWAVTGDPARLQAAACMLAIALDRGDQIRNRAGWLVRAFRYAGEAEHRAAVRRVQAWEPTA